MSKIKPQTGFLFLVLAALFCLVCTDKSGPVPQFAVDNAAAARDVAISYVGPDIGKDAPAADLEWQEENITPPGLMGLATILFATDGWEIAVHHPVVAPGNTIYEVTVVGLAAGWHWQGIVKADGTVIETSTLILMTRETSEQIARDFVKNSPTFTFDGIEDTFSLTGDRETPGRYCWVFVFEFDSRQAGYGDRTGQVLAQVITPHQAVITLEQHWITAAVMDEKWDMRQQKFIAGPGA